MKEQYPFPVDVATVNPLRNVKADKKFPPILERYHNPYHTDPQPDEWPHTIECFAEWYRRHVGLLAMRKPILDEVRRHVGFEDPLDNLISSLLNSLERGFADFHDLLGWAIVAWESDPLISQVRGTSPEVPEPGEEVEEPQTRKVVNLPAQS